MIFRVKQLTGLIALALPISAFAQISNGSFESGDLTGWTVQAGAVEVIQSSNISSPIAPPEGSYFALLSTTPDLLQGGIDSGQDRDNFDGNEWDPAILTQTFDVTTPPEQLSFSVAMLTNEDTIDTSSDVFECLLDGIPLIQGATSATGGSSFPSAGSFDGVSYTVTSTGPTNGSNFSLRGATSFTPVSATITSSGPHTLECFIGDGFDHPGVDSGLLLDDVQLTSLAPPVAATPVPALSAVGILFLSSLIALVGGIRRRKQS